MVSEDTDIMGQCTDSPSLGQKTFLHRQVHLEEYEKPISSTKDILIEKTKAICTCTPKTVFNSFLRLFPVLEWAPRYDIKKRLLGDFVSGIILGITSIPASISFSLLANVDPIYGLYTNFFCCIIYTVFTSSHHNSVGMYAVLCLMVGEVVTKHLKAAGYSNEGKTVTGLFINSSLDASGTVFCDKSCYAIKIATSLTFLVGVYQIIFWIFQLGFISVYLSEPLLSGFVTGSSLTILTSQMKILLGISIPTPSGVGSVIVTWINIFTYIEKTNICDLITSIVTFAVIIPVKEINDWYKSKLKIPIPVEIVVIIVATLVSHFFNFKGKYNSSICGHIPIGFLPPAAPDFSLIPTLAADAFPIAVISFAMTVSLAETFGKKHGYAVRPNQEMLAIGMCNFIHSFFYSFAVSASLGKTLFRESTGGHTQVSSVITSLVVLLVLLIIGSLFFSLQISVLGAIIIANLKGGLQKFSDMPNMWRLSKIDTVIWWVTMLATTLITTEIGLLVGVCFSLLCVIFRTQWPRATLLENVGGTEVYEGQLTYRELSDIPNIKIFRFDAFLYYANKGYFRSMLYEKTHVNPTLVAAMQRKAKKAHETDAVSADNDCFSKFPFCKLTRRPQELLVTAIPNVSFHSLIIDCGAMQFIDTVGLSVLKETHHDYENIGVHVFLANCNLSVRRSLQDGGYFSNCGTGLNPEQITFHGVHEAVQFAQRKNTEQKQDIELINADISFNTSQAMVEYVEE